MMIEKKSSTKLKCQNTKSRVELENLMLIFLHIYLNLIISIFAMVKSVFIRKMCFNPHVSQINVVFIK